MLLLVLLLLPLLVLRLLLLLLLTLPLLLLLLLLRACHHRCPRSRPHAGVACPLHAGLSLSCAGTPRGGLSPRCGCSPRRVGGGVRMCACLHACMHVCVCVEHAT